MQNGGAGGLRGDNTTRDKDMHTTIKQITQRGGCYENKVLWHLHTVLTYPFRLNKSINKISFIKYYYIIKPT